MKKLSVLFLTVMFMATILRGATPAFQDFDGSQFGTNANKVRVKDGAIVTNAVLKIINSATGRGILGERNLESLLWSTTTNGVSTTRLLMAITPDGLIVYSNAFFQGKIAAFSGVGVWTNGVASTGVSNNPNGTISASGLVRAGSLITSGQATISGGGLDVGSLNQFEFLSAPATASTSLAISKAGGTAFLFLDETLNSLTLQSGVFNGNGRGITNVSAQTLAWPTNAAGTATINVSMPFAAVSTNNNINITGFSGFDGTNAFPFSRIYTNTAGSAAVKSFFLPAGTLMLSAPFTNVFYLTNQLVLSGVIYPGFGTNCSITGN